MNPFYYGLVSLLHEYLFLLSNGRKRGRYIQLVDDDRRIDSGNVFVAPSKDDLVLPKKCCECLTDWWASESVDPGCSLKPRIIKGYLF